MAVVVTGLQVLGDVGKGAQVLWVLGCARDVPDLMLCNDVLQPEERRERMTPGWTLCLFDGIITQIQCQTMGTGIQCVCVVSDLIGCINKLHTLVGDGEDDGGDFSHLFS